MSRRGKLWLFAGVVLLLPPLAVLYFWADDSGAPRRLETLALLDHEQLLDKLEHREYDRDGRLLRSVRGASAVDDLETGVISIKQPVIHEYKEDGEEWELTADRGSVERESRTIILVGNVLLRNVGDRDGQVRLIRGDKLVWENQGNEVLWSGDVRVTEGDILLVSDNLRLWEGEDGAAGFESWGQNTRFVQRKEDETVTGAADRFVYDGKNKHLRLRGSASLRRNDNLLRGEEIDYYLDEN